MKIKIAIILLLLLGIKLYAQEKLGMFVDVKRYLDDKYNTKYDIDFQIPYKNLIFQKNSNGYYFSEVGVQLAISQKDSVVYTKEFTENIGVRNKYDVTSGSKSFKDRVSLTLSKPDFKIDLIFTDTTNKKTFNWTYSTELLNKNDLLSDVELISKISTDSTSNLKKFFRKGSYQIPEPSSIFIKELMDSIYVYFEVYPAKGKPMKTTLSIYKDGALTLTKSFDFDGNKPQSKLASINTSDIGYGQYTGILEANDGESDLKRNFEFIVSEQSEKLNFLFKDPDDEYLLMKYVANVYSPSKWHDMSLDAKRNYISLFWEGLAKSLNMPVDKVMKAYKERIDYCNRHYSHFEDGWKSDMGRIYIRKGPPGEIEKDETADDTRFVRKDFQIWKYSKDNNPVYVFVDIQMNGNFKLVYAKNDDQETTNPEWKKYLGTDFDEDRLRN